MTPICFLCKYFEQNVEDLGRANSSKCSLSGKFTHENNICKDYTPVSQNYSDFIDETYEEFGY